MAMFGSSDVLIKIGAQNTASAELKRVGGELRALAKTAVAAVGGFMALKGAVNAVSGAMKELDSLAKTSRKLGLDANALKGLQFAASETAGMLDGQFNMALQRMTRRISEAAQGTGEAVGALNELGLSAQALNAISPDQAFMRIADAMKNVRGEQERVRLAFKLFDSEGVDLVNTLDIGSEALRQYQKEAGKVFGTFNSGELAKIEAANDSIQRLTESLKSLAREAAVQIAPFAQKMVDNQLKVFRGARDPNTWQAVARESFRFFSASGGVPASMTTRTDPFKLGQSSPQGSVVSGIAGAVRSAAEPLSQVFGKFSGAVKQLDDAVNKRVFDNFVGTLGAFAQVFSGTGAIAKKGDPVAELLMQLYGNRPVTIESFPRPDFGTVPGAIAATQSRIMGRAPGRSLEEQLAAKREKQLAGIDKKLEEANNLQRGMIERNNMGDQIIMEGIA